MRMSTWKTSAPRWPLSALLACAVLASGCGEKAKELVASVKEKAGDLASAAQEKGQEAVKSVGDRLGGVADAVQADEYTFQLTLDSAVEGDGCQARFVAPTAAHGGALQLATSWSTPPQSFPALFLHAPTSATSLGQLSGQVLKARMFVQRESGGPVWHNLSKEIEIRVDSVDDKSVSVSLVSGDLASPGAARGTPVLGTMKGALEHE